jgi:hypothetical protein
MKDILRQLIGQQALNNSGFTPIPNGYGEKSPRNISSRCRPYQFLKEAVDINLVTHFYPFEAVSYFTPNIQ